MKKLLLLLALAAAPLNAQVVSSPVQQIQGTNAINRGNAVNVQLTDGAGGVYVAPLPTGAATSALQTTGNTDLGAPGDTACATDNGSCGLNALIQRNNQRLTSILTGPLPASQSGTWNVTNISGTVSLPTGAATSSNQTSTITDLGGVTETAPATDTASSGLNGRLQRVAQRLSSAITLLGQPLQASSATGVLVAANNSDGNNAAGYVGLTTLGFMYGLNGSGGWDRVRGDTNAVSVLPGLSTTFWSYATGATGILSNTTTAVTIKTAAGASVRNYITSCQVSTTAFGAAVPLALRDGAAGTVIWAVTVPTAGFLQPVTMTFPVPLRSTANTLIEVVTTTANTSGTVMLNCQGFTGA